jgi:hypothetical protein
VRTIQVFRNGRPFVVVPEEGACPYIPYVLLREIRLWQREQCQVCKYVLSFTCTYTWDWKKEVLTA